MDAAGVGEVWVGAGDGPLHPLVFVPLVAGNRATLYVVRERRRLWSSRTGGWIVASAAVDLVMAPGVAVTGVPSLVLPPQVVAAVLGAAGTLRAGVGRREVSCVRLGEDWLGGYGAGGGG